MNNHHSPQELRRIGRILKRARESQGHNLAILAEKCQLSVVALAAIESGEQSQLMKRGYIWLDCVTLYARELGIDFAALSGVGLVGSKVIVDDNNDIARFIPPFLKRLH
jgi:transcriptional regulator with XRE-family HTH domain